jgi:hypothetical protein
MEDYQGDQHEGEEERKGYWVVKRIKGGFICTYEDGNNETHQILTNGGGGKERMEI